MEDLEQTIQKARQTVESIPKDHLDLPGRVSNLSS